MKTTIPTKSIIKVNQQIGQGGEHTCYKKGPHVIKVPSKFGQTWQHQDAEKIKKYIQLLIQHGISVQEMEVITKPIIEINGVQEETNYAIKGAFVEKIEQASLEFKDLIEEDSPTRIQQVLQIIKAGQEIKEEEKKLFDPIGSKEIFKTFFKAIPKATIFLISRFTPGNLKEFLRKGARGLDGKTGNFIVTAKGLECIDPGMYDFKKGNGFFLDKLANTYHTFAYTSLLEISKHANSLLPKEQQLNQKSFQIQIEGNKIEKWIARLLTHTLILPLLTHQLYYGVDRNALPKEIGEYTHTPLN